MRVLNCEPPMPKPELILTTPLTGGKSTFVRHLACYLGSCRFCNDLIEAQNHLREVEPCAKD